MIWFLYKYLLSMYPKFISMYFARYLYFSNECIYVHFNAWKKGIVLHRIGFAKCPAFMSNQIKHWISTLLVDLILVAHFCFLSIYNNVLLDVSVHLSVYFRSTLENWFGRPSKKKISDGKKGNSNIPKKKKFVIPSEGCSSPGFITSNRTTLIVSGKKKLN